MGAARYTMDGLSNYEAYEGDWGGKAIGLEIGENIPYAQLKFAMARGASRNTGLPWTSQVSPWYQGCVTTTGPLTGGSTSNNFGNATGQDAGHSLSFYKRTYLHSWFAGAAMLTPEGSFQMFYNTQTATSTLSPYGQAAAQDFAFMRTHDRGVAYTPVTILLDKYAGYNGFEGSPWGLASLKTAGDQKITDLFNKQLFPGSDAYLGTNEGAYIVSTPYGEMFDVQLSSASASTLSSYRKILLAGDITFSSDVMATLESALRSGSQILLKNEHVTAMGAANFVQLQAAGSVQVLSNWTNPATGRDTAISNDSLASIRDALLPVHVTGNVEYELNQNAKGWVLELINDTGVSKTPWLPAVTDPNAVVNVTITPDADMGLLGAQLWQIGQADQNLGLHSSYQVAVGPGDVVYVQLTTVPEPSTGALGNARVAGAGGDEKVLFRAVAQLSGAGEIGFRLRLLALFGVREAAAVYALAYRGASRMASEKSAIALSNSAFLQ